MTQEEVTENFLYHSFPRPKKEENEDMKNERGLKTLKSILKYGLLLVPEIFEIRETLANGNLSPRIINISQNRICLTYLEPNKLSNHSKKFGAFALEFTVETIIGLGGMPVAYFVNRKDNYDFQGSGNTIIARFAEIQYIIQLLINLENSARLSNNMNILNMLNHLTKETQPLKDLLGALKYYSNYFCRIDVEEGKPLDYYQEREWRISAGLQKIKNGALNTRDPTIEEKSEILNTNPEFFNKEIRVSLESDQLCKRIDKVQIYNKNTNDLIRRLIVPKKAFEAALSLLKEFNIPKEKLIIIENL